MKGLERTSAHYTYSAFKPTTPRAKKFIVVRHWVDGEPIKTEPMTYAQACRAQIHFEGLGYDIVFIKELI